MRKSVLVVGALVAMVAGYVLVSAVSVSTAAQEITIKDVMGKAMKGGLCKKVASGKASDEEKKMLVTLFTALNAAKPPKGDEASWKEKTGALLDAAKKIEGGDAAAAKALGKAANRKACHEAHKG
jgi:hypothetical protein